MDNQAVGEGDDEDNDMGYCEKIVKYRVVDKFEKVGVSQKFKFDESEFPNSLRFTMAKHGLDPARGSGKEVLEQGSNSPRKLLLGPAQ